MFSVYNFQFIILCILFVIVRVQSQIKNELFFKNNRADDDCSIEGVEEWSSWVNIMDTDPASTAISYSGKNFEGMNRVVYPPQLHQYFKIDYTQGNETQSISLEILEMFNRDYERNENLIQFPIIAEFTCPTGRKNFSITVNITDTNNNSPRFTPNPPFTFTILLPAGEGTPIIPLYGEIGAIDNDLTTYAIDFGIDDNPYFNISTYRQSNHKKVIYYATIIAKKPVMDMRDTLVVNISATDFDLTGEERRIAYAQLTIIPNVSLWFPRPPTFVKAFHIGQLKDGEVDMEHIPLPEHFDIGDKLSLTGDMADIFTYEITDENSIAIKFNVNTPDQVIRGHNYFIFSMEATNTHSETGFTVILIENIKDNLGLVTLDPVYFSSYYFSNNSIYPTILFEMKCEYGLTIEGYFGDYFKPECNDYGKIELIVLKSLPVDVANNNEFISMELIVHYILHSIATTIVLHLIIPELQMRPMLIIDIEEENEYNSLLNLPEDDCKYNEIVDVWPEEAMDWFDLDYTLGILKSKKIDREHPTIAYMNVSQIQLELSVQCKYSKQTQNGFALIKSTDDVINANGMHWIYTKEIDFSRFKQIVNVIVNDINDNPPIFENENPLHVRYPTSNLAELIRPLNLVTVRANDVDIGVNAEIRYSTDSDKFSVHPETGVVYPVGDIFHSTTEINDEITFIVSATDGNGEGIHTTDINIMVKLLTDNHIAILSVSNGMVEDIPAILKNLSAIISYDVFHVSSTILPGDFIARNSNSDTFLVLYVYALGDDKEILEGSALVNLINEADDTMDMISVITLTSTILRAQDCETTGLIVAVSCLGSILLILSITLAVIFLLNNKHRNRNYHEHTNNRFETDSNSSYPERVETRSPRTSKGGFVNKY